MRTWTPEEMYLYPDRFRSEDAPKLYFGRFTPEFAAYARTETEWVREGPGEGQLPEELRKPIGLGEQRCPRCQGSGIRWVICIGKVTGLRMQVPDRFPCVCQFWRRFWSIWKNVPGRFSTLPAFDERTAVSLTLPVAAFWSTGPGSAEDLALQGMVACTGAASSAARR